MQHQRAGKPSPSAHLLERHCDLAHALLRLGGGRAFALPVDLTGAGLLGDAYGASQASQDGHAKAGQKVSFPQQLDERSRASIGEDQVTSGGGLASGQGPAEHIVRDQDTLGAHAHSLGGSFAGLALKPGFLLESALVGEQLGAHCPEKAEVADLFIGQADVSRTTSDGLGGRGGGGGGLLGALGDGAEHAAHGIGFGCAGGDQIGGQVIGAVLAGEAGDRRNAAALSGHGIGRSRRPLLGQVEGFHGCGFGRG